MARLRRWTSMGQR